MALTKEQKNNILESLKNNIDKQKSIIFVDVAGLKADDLYNLRRELKEAGCSIMVAKKTLMSIAFKESNIEFEKDKFKGELALVFGFSDEVVPAKTTYNFSKGNNNLKILGGILENKLKDLSDIIVLAKIPSRNELLTRVVMSLKAPTSGLVNVLSGNMRDLVYVLSNIKK